MYSSRVRKSCVRLSWLASCLAQRPDVHRETVIRVSGVLLTKAVTIRPFSSLPAHTILRMPALSPTMEKGNIIKWHVKTGDEVKSGTVLADVETDKATLAFENQDEGFMAKILIPEGTRDISVGTPVAVIAEESSDVAAFANYAGEGGASAAAAPAAAAPSAPAAAAPAASSKSYPPHVPLAMPALSPTMEQGNIIAWKVKEGDAIKSGDMLADIETDKAVLGFENQDEGFIAKLLYPPGAQGVKVGTTVAIIVEEEGQVAAFADYTAPAAGAAPAASAPAADTAKAAAVAPAKAKHPHSDRLGPAARHYLEEAGLTADDVDPSGPNHLGGPNPIITAYDVKAAIAAGVKHASSPAASAAPAPAPTASAPSVSTPAATAAAPSPASSGTTGVSYTDIPNTQIRSIIASRLLESKMTAPGIYVSVDCQLDALTNLRAAWLKQGTKVSVNDFVLKAVACALRDVPGANSFWDSKAASPKQWPSIDVSFAVATPGGLITPIIKDAASKSIAAISKEVKDLAGRARDNKLKPDEFQGGTFTVSNLGMFGLDHFSAIINPPQAAILAVGGSKQKVVLVNGAPRAINLMTVTLTADQRVYDADVIGQFSLAFTKYIEAPSLMMI